MKELVETMVTKLSAQSIRHYTNIVKGVVASAINENGEEIFPRKWNDEHIDAPVIGSQRQPSTTADSLTAVIGSAKGHYRMLYALLAGCWPGKLSGSKSAGNLAGLPHSLCHPKGQARPDSALPQNKERDPRS